MTLAAAERNDIRGTVSSEADFRSDTYSGTKFNPCFRNIVAEQLKFTVIW